MDDEPQRPARRARHRRRPRAHPTSSSRRPSSWPKFLDRHRERIAALGGLTLIDDDPDYLSIAPDLTFRSRSRYSTTDTGEWVSETEVIETASELVELYNPADDLRRVRRGRPRGRRAWPPSRRDRRPARRPPAIPPEETFGCGIGDDPYAGAADSWAAGQPAIARGADDEEGAAAALYDLALDYQERSQRSEARLLEQFEERGRARRRPARRPDHRRRRRRAAVARRRPAGSGPRSSRRTATASGATLGGPDELVEFYDPTDVFGDLADALAEAFPAVAPDLEDEADGADEAEGDAAERRRGRRRRRRRTVAPSRRPAPTPRSAPASAAMRRSPARAGRAPRDPAGPVAPGVPRPGRRHGRARRPVRPRPHRRPRRAARVRRPFSINTIDPASGHAHDPLPARHRRADWFTRLRPGDRVDMLGPLGRPFEVDPGAATCCSSRRARRWPASGCSPTRRSATGGRSTLLFGARDARARSTRRACCPTRSSTSSRPTTGRSVTTAT